MSYVHQGLAMLNLVIASMFNPSKGDLNPICHLLALLGVHHILHVSRIKVKEERRE
jgi:hypothetical protein